MYGVITMISYLVPYRDGLIHRRNTTFEFLEYTDRFLDSNIECIICDYNGQDKIEDILTSYKTKYLHIEPNKDDFLNSSKCLNKGTINAKNKLIAPLGIDFRINRRTLDKTIELFSKLGEVIIRPQIFMLDKDGKTGQILNTPYVLNKINILRAHGWDERITEWGKEEDDLIHRIFKYQKILHLSVKGMGYFHIYHDRSWAEECDEKLGDINLFIAEENGKDNGTNLINSYW